MLRNERLSLLLQMVCDTPFPIQLIRAQVQLSDHVTLHFPKALEEDERWTDVDEPIVDPQDQWTNVMTRHEEITNVIEFTPTTEGLTQLGSLCVFFRRMDKDNDDVVVNQLKMPFATIHSGIFDVKVDSPASGTLGEPMVMQISIGNASVISQPIAVTVSETEEFMYSGFKKASFQILPGETTTLNFQLVPVHTGMLNLPQVHVQPKRYDGVLPVLEEVRTLFVFPDNEC
eukprot:TRINITY_DN2789_c0_g2_i2.p1 TRINITY_DN2789_c0_g2~~TRINITY_DN2789_c0_g2_i2.p1  ORF type:complete len:230 (-),score=74.63 TRINITY_DN2789_c0_g2_i2:17-706(-)